MKNFQFIILLLVSVTLLTGCSNSDNSVDQGQLPMVFNVEPFLYKSYDVPQSDPSLEGSASYALGVFTQQPTAIRYTVRYTNEDFPNLNYEITFGNNEPIPSPGNMDPSTPGYENGIIGGQYHIAAVKNGCQSSSASGVCAINGQNTQANEQGLRDIGGSMEVTIEFE